MCDSNLGRPTPERDLGKVSGLDVDVAGAKRFEEVDH